MSSNRRSNAAPHYQANNASGFEVYDPFEADTVKDDEMLARALQEEYQAEFRRSSVDREQQPRSFNGNGVVPGTATPVTPPPVRSSKTPLSQEQKDEVYARQVQKSFRSPPSSSTRNNNNNMSLARELPSAANPSYRKKSSTTTPATSRSNSLDSHPDLNDVILQADDADLARRVTQELGDEDFARRLTEQEQTRVSRTTAMAQAPRQESKIRRFFCYLLPMFVIAASAAAVIYYVMYGSENLPDWMPNPEEFANEDPFTSQNANATSRWWNKGEGLELDILNSLDSRWYSYFYVAVEEWDNGSPDTLTLRTTAIDADSSCKTVPRTLKVCNGNYGETSWRGINKLLLEDRSIYASAARMNEYYFGNNDEDQRQYTMCHEIGHGFGLPHTDESFTNKDLGNCMDYTNRPQNNRQPDITNFEFLKELYGVVPGQAVAVSETLPTEQVQPVTEEQDETQREKQEETQDETQQEKQQEKQKENDTKEKGKKEKNGHRRGLKGQSTHRRTWTDTSYSKEDHPNMPHRVLRSLESAEHQIENGLWTLENGWTLLHRSEHGEAHEKHVGDGFSVQVHLLLA